MKGKEKANIKIITIIGITVLALLIIGGIIYAYFTIYAYAEGIINISDISTKQTLNETFEDWKKSITVTNEKDDPVYIRVKAFAPIEVELQTIIGNNWEKGKDDYYYYNLPLNKGETTSNLQITIDKKMITEDFDVVVIQEGTLVKYEEDGTPYPDWNDTYIIKK